MPLRPAQPLVVVTLVLAAHAGVIALLESGLQHRPSPVVSAPSVLTVGLLAPHSATHSAPPQQALRSAAPAPSARPAPTYTVAAPVPSARPAPTTSTHTVAATAPATPPTPTQSAAYPQGAEAQGVVATAGATSGAIEARWADGSAAAAGPPASTGHIGHVGHTGATSRTGAPSVPELQLPSTAASHLNNPPPRYPPLSRRLGEQGKVVVRVRIEVDGSASQAEINTSSGYTRLDEAALHTVLSWRYLPGTRNGVPQAMWFHVPIHFVLE